MRYEKPIPRSPENEDPEDTSITDTSTERNSDFEKSQPYQSYTQLPLVSEPNTQGRAPVYLGRDRRIPSEESGEIDTGSGEWNEDEVFTKSNKKRGHIDSKVKYEEEMLYNKHDSRIHEKFLLIYKDICVYGSITLLLFSTGEISTNTYN